MSDGIMPATMNSEVPSTNAPKLSMYTKKGINYPTIKSQ